MTKGVPEEFSKYLNYIRNLQFEDKPDYNLLRQLFKTIMIRFDYQYDGAYDWLLKKEGKEDVVKAMLKTESGKVSGFDTVGEKKNSMFEE